MLCSSGLTPSTTSGGAPVLSTGRLGTHLAARSEKTGANSSCGQLETRTAVVSRQDEMAARGRVRWPGTPASGLPASSRTGTPVLLAGPKTAVQRAGGAESSCQLSVMARLPGWGTFRAQRSAATAEQGQGPRAAILLLPAPPAAAGKPCARFHALLREGELCRPCPRALSSCVFLRATCTKSEVQNVLWLFPGGLHPT